MMRKSLKKVTALMIAAGVLVCCAACSGAGDEKEQHDDLRIVATIFPIYDWTREIIGDGGEDTELTLLLDKGTDLHSYEPTARDILTISTCDVFICVGGESDAWVKDALKEAVNEDMTVIFLLDVLGDSAYEEELKEGMEEETEDVRDALGLFDEKETETAEMDEHVWLSLKNAKLFTAAIADALEHADAKHADIYEKNAENYQNKLDALDQKYEEAASREPVTLVFGDRFPFRYLTEDYGLDYYAAFLGCSAETETSFETVLFLADRIDELDLDTIYIIDGSTEDLANTIRENTASRDQKICVLDSMQSVTATDLQNGVSYLSVMEKNYDMLFSDN